MVTSNEICKNRPSKKFIKREIFLIGRHSFYDTFNDEKRKITRKNSKRRIRKIKWKIRFRKKLNFHKINLKINFIFHTSLKQNFTLFWKKWFFREKFFSDISNFFSNFYMNNTNHVKKTSTEWKNHRSKSK